MAKIYASGNYVIVDDGVKVYEYAKGHTLYTLVDDVFYIKEINTPSIKLGEFHQHGRRQSSIHKSIPQTTINSTT